MITEAVGVIVFFGVIVFLLHLLLQSTVDKGREDETQRILEDQERQATDEV